MAKPFVEPIEPSEMASRFSNEDSLDVVPTGLDEEWKEDHIDEIESVLDQLPEDEADILEQYFFNDKKQVNIADIFKKTQAAVSYNIQRALQRVRFLVRMPDVDKEQVYRDLREWHVIEDELNAKIFAEMFDTSCQSKVAERLDLTQGRVRHRFLSNLIDMGHILLNRLEPWVQNNIQDELQQEFYIEDIQEARQGHKSDEIDDEEFEQRVRDLFHRLRTLQNYNMGDLGRLFEYFRTFVKIRHNYNILRKIDLPK
jgi:hypothetical protein